MLEKIIRKTAANFPAQQNINLGEVGRLWMHYFEEKPDDVMDGAVNLVLLNSRTWPTVRDINDAVNSLTADKHYASAVFRRLEYSPKSRQMSPAVQKALAMVKSGRAKEFFAGMDISAVREYAKSVFPDISESVIRKNYNELDTAKSCLERCRSCMWTTADCDTSGFYIAPVLKKGGWISNEYKMCPKHSSAKKRRLV